jgi:hypothetical protein
MRQGKSLEEVVREREERVMIAVKKEKDFAEKKKDMVVASSQTE